MYVRDHAIFVAGTRAHRRRLTQERLYIDLHVNTRKTHKYYTHECINSFINMSRSIISIQCVYNMITWRRAGSLHLMQPFKVSRNGRCESAKCALFRARIRIGALNLRPSSIPHTASPSRSCNAEVKSCI